VAAAAFESGELTRGEGRQPYKGYLYRILTRQGATAPGGERSYLAADQRLTGGFAFLAFPAEYGETGLMTFLVSSDGLVYEKDLGADTAKSEAAITSFDPGDWAPRAK
jgi:hypothetical protein